MQGLKLLVQGPLGLLKCLESHTMLLVHAADDQSDVKIKESLLVSPTDVKVEPSFNTAIPGVSALQERSGRIYFKKVKTNPAAGLQTLNPTPTTVDTQSDLMFSTPGIYIRKEVGIEDKRQSGARWSAQSSAPDFGPMKKSRGSEC
ncbi:hypothetical protein B0H13DRAFT_1917676 [Mycena leptocephala]|nr:hypothetical protein B0H13DRAFT_1917676 [Mycena leptocephala]